MQRIWGWLHLEKCFFIPHELADKENACTSESRETFHWASTNLQLLLCDTCEIISQWIECFKANYVVCKAKRSKIESLLTYKHFLGDSSLFCLTFQCHIVICHHSTITLEHMQRIWGWLHLEKCFFIPHELADKENACTSESRETFHWASTNLQLLLCDTCEIYTWIYENRVSKDWDSFHYLAIKNNENRPKAD